VRYQLSRGTLFGATQAAKELTEKDEEIQWLKKEFSQAKKNAKSEHNH